MKRAKTPLNKQILIVSDSTDELKDIQYLLMEDFGGCLKADNEPDGLQLFSEYQPAVLILAFEEVEKAEHFYLLLYRHNSQIYTVQHQTLLLCKSNESDKAFQLCKSGTFDDFVADRPLYDPFRLRLSVAQALSRGGQEQYANLLSRKIDKIAVELRQFDHFIRQELAAGSGQYQETTNRFHYFTQKLATDLKQLEESLTGHASGVNSQTMDNKNLRHQFDQFRRESLQHESQHVMEQLDKTENWLETLNNDYEERVKVIQQESQTATGMHVMLIDDDEFYREYAHLNA